jgi:hypothetical protein
LSWWTGFWDIMCILKHFLERHCGFMTFSQARWRGVWPRWEVGVIMLPFKISNQLELFLSPTRQISSIHLFHIFACIEGFIRSRKIWTCGYCPSSGSYQSV